MVFVMLLLFMMSSGNADIIIIYNTITVTIVLINVISNITLFLLLLLILIIIIISSSSNGNRTEWSPIRSAIITSEKQNWMSAERESNLFSRVMIKDRIGRHEVLLQIYYKNYNFRKISKAVISRLKTAAVRVRYSPFCFGRSFSEIGCCCLLIVYRARCLFFFGKKVII